MSDEECQEKQKNAFNRYNAPTCVWCKGLLKLSTIPRGVSYMPYSAVGEEHETDIIKVYVCTKCGKHNARNQFKK